MTTRKAVRSDLQTVIGHATVNSVAVRVVPFIPDAIPAPCATVRYLESDPRMVFGEAKSAYGMEITLWVPRTSDRTAQDWLDDACDPQVSTSVVTAIQTTSNWTQTIDYAQVVAVGPVQEQARGDDVFMTVDLTLEVVW